MSRNLWIPLLPVSVALLMAADQPQPWKDKQAAQWTEEDTKLILSDSPWVKKVKPFVQSQQVAQPRQAQQRNGGGMGRGGGGIGGLSIPGIGSRRYPGGGGGGEAVPVQAGDGEWQLP